MSRATDAYVSRSAQRAALVAPLRTGCGSTAPSADAQGASDATTSLDTLVVTDTPVATDAPSSPDLPATPDLSAMTDAASPGDAATESSDLTLPAARRLLRMRVRDGLPETDSGVCFSTSSAAGVTQLRSARVATVARDTALRERVAEMSANPAWTGTITNTRVDFGSSPRGQVDVDWIGFDA